MSRELAPWSATEAKRRPAGPLADTVGDLRLLATGWHWDLALEVVKAAASTAVGTVRGDRDAPPIPTAWARTPFLVAARDLAQTGVLRPLLTAEVNLESHGTERLVRRSGPTLLVANHASHLDIGAVLTTLPASWRERTAVALTSDAFFQSWWKAGAAALAFNTFQLPQSEPSADGSSRFEVGPLAKVLASGWNVLVFPEGGRTRDGVVQSFHADVAAVAARLSVPVVPIGVRGTFTAMPQGTHWPRQGRPRVAVRYGTALEAQPAESAEVFTTRIHRAVADLIDEDASTWWRVRRDPGHEIGDDPSARWRRIWQQSEEPTAGGRPRRRRIWRS
jgi:1-acyl-sn-glycerol-3-phosphate acyltransferase